MSGVKECVLSAVMEHMLISSKVCDNENENMTKLFFDQTPLPSLSGLSQVSLQTFPTGTPRDSPGCSGNFNVMSSLRVCERVKV